MDAPTQRQYDAYQWMFDFFNKELFSGSLATCLLVFSTRIARIGGHFAAGKWERASQKVHEININPAFLSIATDVEIASVLVHEMCHLKQAQFGSSGTGGYHNKQWASYMEEIGLRPSNTGKPGGKKTGFQMSHYVIKGGKFELAFEKMPKNMFLPFRSKLSSRPNKRRKGKEKIKYNCSQCGTNLWGKPGLTPLCGSCLMPMTSQGDANDLSVKRVVSIEAIEIGIYFLKMVEGKIIPKGEVPFYFVEALVKEMLNDFKKEDSNKELRQKLLHGLCESLDFFRERSPIYEFLNGRNILN